ncbi:hypothetical protein [Lentzea tibetensis]|uniref:hypothetical protein n=1 Tax=Lentzea tibetensis TaxID=2591470 RepID=UPI0016472ECE|nr:hypothetical protein [Lentzea tibetensis]
MDKEPKASAPPVAAKRSPRVRAAALFNSSVLLATTALIIAIEPKAPPFKGD